MTAVNMRRWLPQPARRAGREAYVRTASLTAPWRPLPDFLIIGAARAGSTSLYEYLGRHPSVLPALVKEVHYFTTSFDRGERWYRAHFPSALRRRLTSARHGMAVTGEATPYYLFQPQAPARIHALLPRVKLLAVLRDPVARAVSHYQHERRLGVEDLSLRDAIAREDERTAGGESWPAGRLEQDAELAFRYQHFTYRARGRYAEQLQRYFALFPKDQIMVIRSEDLFERGDETYRKVLEFLGLRAHTLAAYPRTNASRGMDVDPSVLESLGAYFAPHNAQLEALLGREMGW